jgi:putative transcriptional regulator
MWRRWKKNPMRDPVLDWAKPPKGTRIKARDRREFEAGDVIALRSQYELSQVEFARLVGISPETLRNWESGRRCPLGPARALLRILAADPHKVLLVLSDERMECTPIEANDPGPNGEPFEYEPPALEQYRRRQAQQDAARKRNEALTEKLAAQRSTSGGMQPDKARAPKKTTNARQAAPTKPRREAGKDRFDDW